MDEIKGSNGGTEEGLGSLGPQLSNKNSVDVDQNPVSVKGFVFLSFLLFLYPCLVDEKIRRKSGELVDALMKISCSKAYVCMYVCMYLIVYYNMYFQRKACDVHHKEPMII